MPTSSSATQPGRRSPPRTCPAACCRSRPSPTATGISPSSTGTGRTSTSGRSASGSTASRPCPNPARWPCWPTRGCSARRCGYCAAGAGVCFPSRDCRTAIWPLESCDTKSQWVSGRKTSASVPADSRSRRASPVTATYEARGNRQRRSEPSGPTGSGKDGTGEWR
jgi:hypothetical protein